MYLRITGIWEGNGICMESCMGQPPKMMENIGGKKRSSSQEKSLYMYMKKWGIGCMHDQHSSLVFFSQRQNVLTCWQIFKSSSGLIAIWLLQVFWSHDGKYQNFASHHHLQKKLGIVKTLFHWCDSIVTDPAKRRIERETIKNALMDLGYPEWATCTYPNVM